MALKVNGTYSRKVDVIVANMEDFFGSVFGKRPKPDMDKSTGNKAWQRFQHYQFENHDEREFYKPDDVIGGKYEVHRKIGKGGFGVVYLVYDRDRREICAMKTFRDEFLADTEAREAFKKEALLWVRLDKHPYILSAKRVEELSDRLFVIMDYIAPDRLGRTNLADHLANSAGKFDLIKSLKWAIQFCNGMEHANSHGIKSHRDIKPANILITQDGTLKIADFGLATGAKAAMAGSNSSLVTTQVGSGFGMSILQTQNKRVCGTPGYIAPEVYEGRNADVRSDIYSFGLVLWQMVTGSLLPPFHVDLPRHKGEDNNTYAFRYMEAVYRRQKTDDVPMVGWLLSPIIKRCICPDIGVRYGNFKQLRLDLETILKHRFLSEVAVPDIGKHKIGDWNDKGVSLHSLGRYQEAINCYDKVLQTDPQKADTWNNKGVSLHSLGQHEEAIKCYNKSLRIAPQKADTWNNKGISLDYLGRHWRAIRCYNKALRINPRKVDTWNNKGVCLNSFGWYKKAIECFDNALKFDSRNANAWYNKGVSFDSLGRYQEAVRYYVKAFQINPQIELPLYARRLLLKAYQQLKGLR